MHELSIAASLVETLCRVAEQHRASRLVSAQLRLGRLTHVELETLRFAFGVASRATPAEGCRLEVERVDVTLHCRGCDWHGAHPAGFGAELPRCPRCHTVGLDVEGGRELELVTVDLED